MRIGNALDPPGAGGRAPRRVIFEVVPPRSLSDWVALSLLPRLGPARIHRLLARFGGPGEALRRATADELVALGLSAERAAEVLDARGSVREHAEADRKTAERMGIEAIALDDPRYPPLLAAIADPPPLLWVRGELREPVVRVAIVGSRRPTLYGERVSAGLAAGLAARGVEVVSGGARGIDTCSHVGALEEGGRTVAVLGSGLLHLYPDENRDLFDRIAGSGAIVSEFPLDTGPKPDHFPRRNRVISGLAAAVVVIEAAARSGTLITAGHALEQGREVMAVPGPVSSDRSAGTHRLIQEGARLVQNVDDVLAELSPMYRDALAPPPGVGAGGPAAGPGPAATGDEAEVLKLLDGWEPVHVDDLAERVPFGISRLQAALLGLELGGRAEQRPGGWWVAGRGAT
jgi:DNA processing protein